MVKLISSAMCKHTLTITKPANAAQRSNFHSRLPSHDNKCCQCRLKFWQFFALYIFFSRRRINVALADAEERRLSTGLHVVADIHCNICDSVLGWKYVRSLLVSFKVDLLSFFHTTELTESGVQKAVQRPCWHGCEIFRIITHSLIHLYRWKLLMNHKSTRRTNS